MQRLKRNYYLLFLLLVISLSIYNGFDYDGGKQSIRQTGRYSCTLFMLAFAAAPLFKHFQIDFIQRLLQQRRILGISFAFVHLYHLALIVWLNFTFDPQIFDKSIISIVGGVLAYCFIIAMLLTSFSTFSKHLSTLQWKRLHTVGSYWIWLLFFLAYVKRVGEQPLHWITVGIFVSIILLRLIPAKKH